MAEPAEKLDFEKTSELDRPGFSTDPTDSEETSDPSPLGAMLAYQARKAARKDPNEGNSDSNWLLSYADMMTLLLGFFVMLLVFAKVDLSAFDQIKIELKKSFGTMGRTVSYSEFQGNLDAALQDGVMELGAPLEGEKPKPKSDKGFGEKTEGQQAVKKNDKEILITFGSTSMFSSGSAELTREAKGLVATLLPVIKKNAKEFTVVVEGHTDGRPMRSKRYPSNWELSSARAATIVRILERQGFPKHRLRSMGFADSQPILREKDDGGIRLPENEAKNRRVVVRILKK